MRIAASVLVVDDSALHRKQMASLLQRQGYDAKLAASASEAFRLLLRESVFLVIASAKMPRWQAFAMAKQMKEAPRLQHIPFFLIMPRTIRNPKVEGFLEKYVDETFVQPIQVAPFLEKVDGHARRVPDPVAPKPSLPENRAGALPGAPKNRAGALPGAPKEGSTPFSPPSRTEAPLSPLSPASSLAMRPSPPVTEAAASPAEAGERESRTMIAELEAEANRQLLGVLRGSRAPVEHTVDADQGGYLNYFGFRFRPFSNTPDDRFYYSSSEHSKALLRLSYVVENMEGLATLIGNIGAGKTTLARRLLASLDPDEFEAALMVIVHSSVTPDWLLHRVSTELGVINAPKDKLQLIGELYRRLIEIHQEGRRAVILIDEAQMLQTRALMEELRGLLNLEVPGKKLLTFVLFGLSSLDDVLNLDPPLRQRVAIRYRLLSFDRPTVADYVMHRMRIAGVDEELFATEALDLIYAKSHGIPRLINTLCNNCLLEAYLGGEELVSRELVVTVCDSLLLEAAVTEP